MNETSTEGMDAGSSPDILTTGSESWTTAGDNEAWTMSAVGFNASDWRDLLGHMNFTNTTTPSPEALAEGMVRMALNMRIDLWKELATPTPAPAEPLDEPGKQSDDAVWIMVCCFMIFVMQSGFAQLEAGAVHIKNNVNIIMKNALDIVFGGVSFWMFGYGLAFGMDGYSNAFSGVGYFFVEVGEEKMGEIYLHFLFQLSFCTTATTIVSGAMAERTRLSAYVMFSFFNTIVYSFPSHWVWDEKGFLRVLGCIDIAGSGVVHLVGGVSGLVATLKLGPRHGRFDGPKGETKPPPMGDVPTCLYGTFTLWWGWLAFNCGSTFGVRDNLWKLAAKAAVSTMTSSMGGGIIAMIYSLITKKKQWDVGDFIYGVLGSLVSITGERQWSPPLTFSTADYAGFPTGCALISPWEGFIVGAIGGLLSVSTPPLLERLQVDDPVGVLPVHMVAAVWGLLAVGFFAVEDTKEGLSLHRSGLFHGGGWYLLGVQTLTAVSIIVWTLAAAFILLEGVDVVMGLRLPLKEELVGSDLLEHDIRHPQFPISEEMERNARAPTPDEGKKKKKKTDSGFQFEDGLSESWPWYRRLFRRCRRTQGSIRTNSSNIEGEAGIEDTEQRLRPKTPSIYALSALNLKDPQPHPGTSGQNGDACNGAPSMASMASLFSQDPVDAVDAVKSLRVSPASPSTSDGATRGSLNNRLYVGSAMSGASHLGEKARMRIHSIPMGSTPPPDLSSLDTMSVV